MTLSVFSQDEGRAQERKPEGGGREAPVQMMVKSPSDSNKLRIQVTSDEPGSIFYTTEMEKFFFFELI